MTDQETIATLRSALRKAEEERDRWRNLADGKGLLVAKNEGFEEGKALMESDLAEARKRLGEALRISREVLRWREAEENDAFPHDTRLSLIELCEKTVQFLAQQEAPK